MLGVEVADCACDVESPVPALCHVLVVAEGEHEFVACFGVLLCGEAPGFDAGAEAVVGEGGGHDVECRAAGGGEEGEDVEDFEKGAGPCIQRLDGFVGGGGLTAVNEEKRNGVLGWALLPDEMDV